MVQEDALTRIKHLRTMLLAMRFCYYCFDDPIITDFEYDKRETELKNLLAEHPELDKQAPYSDICPTKIPGSCYASDYPDEIEALARRLSEYHQKVKDGETETN